MNPIAYNTKTVKTSLVYFKNLKVGQYFKFSIHDRPMCVTKTNFLYIVYKCGNDTYHALKLNNPIVILFNYGR